MIYTNLSSLPLKNFSAFVLRYAGDGALGELAMKKLQCITGLSLAALLLVGCTSKNKDVSQAPTTKPSVALVPIDPKNPNYSQPQAVPPVPEGLIQPTQPIIIPIAKDRRDPFGSVAVAPIRQSTPATTTPKLKTQPTKTPSNKTQPTKTQPTKTPSSKTQSTQVQPNRTQPSNSQTANETKVINPPPNPTPSTELANAVEVSGVMQTGGKWSAIVKASGDSTSRYVSTGDYVSNGVVLVKRVELGIDKEPLVILEQNGIEVVKRVGKPITSAS
ncbi:MAG TPA: hypothetical protein DDZ80_18905 [Cyanobacteria bacterium UBA8803]|nr:hypothetical protein [Cyanobacteria bacterium UBA8803]